mmetsp:Transcript_20228/g.30437  ORF Transcript_20228/g.30437 Transcript_20228/m.30437 type:complete len:84 (-) Transcript_20228:223-474(-)
MRIECKALFSNFIRKSYFLSRRDDSVIVEVAGEDADRLRGSFCTGCFVSICSLLGMLGKIGELVGAAVVLEELGCFEVAGASD